MKKDFFRPSTLHPTHGYSHAISVEGGRLVVLSGQVSFDEKRELVGEGDFAAQTRQVFENIGFALSAAGASYADVIKLDYFVTDFNDEYRDTIVKIRDEYICTENPPVNTLLGVTTLGAPGLLIEIEATAFIE